MAEPAPDPHESGPESDATLQLIGVPADTDVSSKFRHWSSAFF